MANSTYIVYAADHLEPQDDMTARYDFNLAMNLSLSGNAYYIYESDVSAQPFHAFNHVGGEVMCITYHNQAPPHHTVKKRLDDATKPSGLVEQSIVHIVMDSTTANDIVRQLPQRQQGQIVGDVTYDKVQPNFSPTIGRMPGPKAEFTFPYATTLYLAEQWYSRNVNGDNTWKVDEDLLDTIVYPGDFAYLSRFRYSLINTVAVATGMRLNSSRRRLFGSPIALFPLLEEIDLPDSLLLDTLKSGVPTIVVNPHPDINKIEGLRTYSNLIVSSDDIDEIVSHINIAKANLRVNNNRITVVGSPPSGAWEFQVGDMNGFPT